MSRGFWLLSYLLIQCVHSVFGFPPGDSGVILSRFQKYGEIMSHSIGNGNWLKLEYSTKLAAEQALQQNGKLVRSEYMIGVKPVIPLCYMLAVVVAILLSSNV